MSERKYRKCPDVTNHDDGQVLVWFHPGVEAVRIEHIPELIARLEAFVPRTKVAQLIDSLPEVEGSALASSEPYPPKRVSRADSSVYVAKQKRPAKRKRKAVR